VFPLLSITPARRLASFPREPAASIDRNRSEESEESEETNEKKKADDDITHRHSPLEGFHRLCPSLLKPSTTNHAKWTNDTVGFIAANPRVGNQEKSVSLRTTAQLETPVHAQVNRDQGAETDACHMAALTTQAQWVFVRNWLILNVLVEV